MLQTIHDKAKGWIAYVILGLISIPFALWGINSYFEGGNTVVAAVVNGEDIPAYQVQNQLAEMRQQFGPMAANLDPNMLKEMALDSVINQTLLKQKVESDGYRASTQEVASTITSIEVFQENGQFSREKYQTVLANNRRSPTEFEQQLRADITNAQFQQGIAQTAFVPKAQAEQYESLQTQKRDIAIATLKVADLEPQVQVSDEKIAEYYEQNKNNFMTDERVKLAYVELDQEHLAKDVAVDEANLQTYYEEHADVYVTPASRHTSRILVAVSETVTDEQAKQKADALYKAIQSGEKQFVTAATTESDDKLASANGGVVGDVVMGDWSPEFEKAVFAATLNQVTEPVRTSAGYELILVDAEVQPVQKPFADVKTQVEADYRKAEADKLFLEKSEQLQSIAYEQNGDLAPAATAAGLKVQESDWLTRAQGEGIAANPKVREAAFAEDVLKGGKNSEAVQLSDTHLVFVRVLAQEAPQQKPLAEVREAVISTLKMQEARQQVLTKGNTLLEQTQTSGWPALDAAGMVSAEVVEKPGLIGRTGSAVAPEVVKQVFAMNPPAEGQIAWGNAVLANGDYVIIALQAVEAGKAEVDAGALARYDNVLGSREAAAAIQALRDNAEIERHPENL